VRFWTFYKNVIYFSTFVTLYARCWIVLVWYKANCPDLISKVFLRLIDG